MTPPLHEKIKVTPENAKDLTDEEIDTVVAEKQKRLAVNFDDSEKEKENWLNQNEEHINQIHENDKKSLKESVSRTCMFEDIQTIGKFPEGNDLMFDIQWLNRVYPLKKIISEARNYFRKKQEESFKTPINLKDINPSYMYILQQCIDFSEAKKKINDGYGQNMNHDIYKKMTGRLGYSSTIGLTKNLISKFFTPFLYEYDNKIDRDTFEQATRICDYVVEYFNDYEAYVNDFIKNDNNKS